MANPNPEPHPENLKKGNTVGVGRPASLIRRRMRGSLAARIHIAEEIADSTESSAADRLRALDFLAKYGVGTKQTINVAELSTDVIRALLEEESEEGAGEEGGESEE